MSSDETELYNLTRRKVLGGMTAVGIASVGAGLGTTAYFSDTETYEGNVLTAGSLDLVVDWEEHYSDWSEDESEGLQHDVHMADPGDSAYVPFPTPIEPVLYVHEDDIDQFMDNTSIDAYPDTDDDGIQDDLDRFDACDDFAQLRDNLDPTNGRGAGKRTLSSETVFNYDEVMDNGAVADPKPLVWLDDIKPGDFGELTLSMHLCDNPGYIWLQGELVAAAENGHTEPEANDGDEVGPADSTDPADVELLDEIQTMLWYDEDGDNVYEPGGVTGDVDVVIVFDRSGSMGGSKIANAKTGAETLVDALGGGAEIGLVSFANSASVDQGLTSDKSAVKTAIGNLSASGSTNMESAIDTAQAELAAGRAGASKVMVVLGDGQPNVNGDGTNENDPVFGNADPADNAAAAKTAGTEIFTIAYGISAGTATANLMREMASGTTSAEKDAHAYVGVTPGEISAVFSQIGLIIAGEECFFQGSLRTLLDLVEADPSSGEFGIPLDGLRASEFDEITGDDDNGDGFVDNNYAVGAGDDPNRDPFVDSTTNALGLAWWLPVDHANEIQTDSVTFDLGFYTEQARHNSGAGQAPETA